MTKVGELEEVMAQDNRTIKELSASGLDNATPLCIQYLAAAQGKTEEFELKSSLLHHIPKYHGLSMQDPNKHLKEFEVVCSSMTPINVNGSILKMKAFPFSLLEKAKDWLYELAPRTVTSWESMKRAFLEKFFLLIMKSMQIKDKKVAELEKQVGQIAEFVGKFREQDKLPSSTVVNPKGGFESAKAIMLRSGKQVGTAPQPSKSTPNEVEELIIEEGQSMPTAREEPPLPFMQSKKEEVEKDILETFRKVQENIPILDAIKQVLRFESAMVDLDFYVLEMDESDHTPSLPILLGRPFMRMARTKIDVFNGTLTIEFDGEVINFNLSDFMKYPSENHSCFAIDVIDSLAQDHFNKMNDDALELVIA
ncbi:unnamed protein product [Malus baccata var. baccata]